MAGKFPTEASDIQSRREAGGHGDVLSGITTTKELIEMKDCDFPSVLFISSPRLRAAELFSALY